MSGWFFDPDKGKTKKVGSFYQLTQRLGSGGFAEVYRAFDTRSGVDVALKIYREPASAGADQRARKEEAVLLRLGDAGAPFFPSGVYSLKERINNKWHPVLVMELGEYHWPVHGPGGQVRYDKGILSLESLLPRPGAPSEPSRPEFWQQEHLAAWVLDLCEAVRLMHQHGVLHLDLKPANVLLERQPGEERSVPFLIDFNTSDFTDRVEKFSGATGAYQAPEVKDGRRTRPGPADDLYALALLLWELHFGVGTGLAPGTGPAGSPWVPYPVDRLREVLRRALHADPEKRFASAEELQQALAESLREPEKTPPVGLRPEEMAYVREKAPLIRENLEEIFTGSLALYLPKAMREEVSGLFESLTSDTTHSVDLGERLLRLGTKVIPVIFEEGYRLDPGSGTFTAVADVLAELGGRERKRIEKGASYPPDRALASIEHYCLSSRFGVRRLCRELCERLEVFPQALLASLRDDDEVYLPQERDELVDMCIRLCDRPDGPAVLVRYLCTEYLEEPSRETYFDLRDRVASRFGEVRAEGKAELLVAVAHDHTWEGIDDYDRLGEEQKKKRSSGILQLLADAFASLGEEGLSALRGGRVKPVCKDGWLKIWSVFALKLCREHAAAREWLERLAGAPRGVPYGQLRWVKERLEGRGDDGHDEKIDVGRLLEEYLTTGSAAVLGRLIWSGRLAEVLDLLRGRLEGTPDGEVVRRALGLLRRYGGRMRKEVLDLAFAHWERFAAAGYADLIETVCLNGLPAGRRREAIEQLQQDVKVAGRRDLALDWLDRLLERDET
jgi:serine/threonine protein kinase